MSRRLLWLLPMVLIALLAAPVLARKWEFKEDTVEAEIGYLTENIVWLVRPDGSCGGWFLKDFNAADRKVVDAWIEKHEGGPIGETIEVSASGHRQTIRFAGKDPMPQASLVATLRFRGKPAAAATEFHDLKFEVETDDGRTSVLELIGTPASYSRSSRIARDNPSWGFREQIKWKAPERPLQGFRKLKGSVVVTTGTPRSFVVEEVDFKKNRAIEHPLLEKALLEVKLNPPGDGSGTSFPGSPPPQQIKVTIKGGQHRVYDVELLDRHDKRATPNVGYVGSSWKDHVSGNWSESGTYDFTFFDAPPKEAMRLRITVLNEVREVPVTFEFTDFAFPPLSGK